MYKDTFSWESSSDCAKGIVGGVLLFCFQQRNLLLLVGNGDFWAINSDRIDLLFALWTGFFTYRDVELVSVLNSSKERQRNPLQQANKKKKKLKKECGMICVVVSGSPA